MSVAKGLKGKRSSSNMLNVKKKGATPDHTVPVSPPPPVEVFMQETGVDDVLDDEEISMLLYREDMPPSTKREESQRSSKKVLVRKVIHFSKEEAESQASAESSKVDGHTYKRVGILYPLSPRFPDPVDHAPYLRYDKDRTILKQSILGSVEEFAKELKNRKLVESTSKLTQPPPVARAKVPRPPPPQKDTSYKRTILPREKYALRQWEKSMSIRRRQQQALSEKLQKSPSKLAMSKGDNYRKVQEERELIDTHLPRVDYGKGYRKGSEFWKQQERLGDDETGIHMTLTKTEKGRGQGVELVGVPSVTRREMSRSKENPEREGGVSNWHKSQYLSKRRRDLKGTRAGARAFRPQFSGLQVVGANSDDSKGREENVSGSKKESVAFRASCHSLIQEDSLDLEGEVRQDMEEEMDEDAAHTMDGVTTDSGFQPYIGPSLKLGQYLLQWMGPSLRPGNPSPPKTAMHSHMATESDRIWRSHSDLSSVNTNKPTGASGGVGGGEMRSQSLATLPTSWSVCTEDREGVDVRIVLEGRTGSMTTEVLNMENCGTTAVYYSWQPLPRKNLLGTVQAGSTQRFYFDTKGGVLLPGEKRSFPFLFKSDNPGIFSEQWKFVVSPVLNEGKTIVVTLKGVAYQEDLYKQQREQIERTLTSKEAEATSGWIIQSIVNSIRTPPTTPPTDKKLSVILTDEDIFKEKNPHVYYHYDVVQQLKALHDAALSPIPEPEPVDTKATGKKGGDDKGASGASKKGAAGKDRKSKLDRRDTLVPDPADVPAVVPDLPKWDLSLDSLLEIVLKIENDSYRNDKLKQLSQLLGRLSFPPVQVEKTTNYQLCYQLLCEVVDTMVDTSAHLCQTMGMPVREWVDPADPGGKAPSEPEDLSHSTHSQSPVTTGGKRKATSKDKKESKKTPKPDKDKSTLSVGKAKKSSKTGTKGTDSTNEVSVSSTAVPLLTEVDPVLELKYRESLSVAVNKLLGKAIEKMTLLIADESSNLLPTSLS